MSMMTDSTNLHATESQARRAAAKIGLKATKSRYRGHSSNHLGGFQIHDPLRNQVVNGVDYEMTADEVIEFCKDYVTT